MMDLINDGLKFHNKNELSRDVRDLIRKMLCSDSIERITIDEVFSHPWLWKSNTSSSTTESEKEEKNTSTTTTTNCEGKENNSFAESCVENALEDTRFQLSNNINM